MARRGVKWGMSNEDIEKLIIKTNGNITAVARSCKVDRHTLYKRIKASAKLQQALQTAREEALDVAESVLFQRAIAGNTQELLFFLRTRGAERGYADKQQVEHSGEGAVIRVVYGERPKPKD